MIVQEIVMRDACLSTGVCKGFPLRVAAVLFRMCDCAANCIACRMFTHRCVIEPSADVFLGDALAFQESKSVFVTLCNQGAVDG